MWALEVETVRDVSLAVVGAAVLLAVLLAWLAKAIVSKLLAIAVFAGLGALVWLERKDVQTCADQVLDTLSEGTVDDATCRFFGHDVTVSSPLE